MIKLVIRTSKLSGGYDKKQIIFDVDFIAANQITAVVGANGSGKSTLLKSICGLCDVHSGSITLHDKNIVDTNTHEITGLGISYMSQTDNVFSELSVHENLVIANMPSTPDADYIFDNFPDLKPLYCHKARQLSGGQRQLLAMAMTLSKKPQVMLFDEPTANLSPKNAKAVLEKIKEMQRLLGNCTILVEQNVKAALEICDRCYLLAGGRVAYEGDPQKLLSDPDLAKKYLGVM